MGNGNGHKGFPPGFPPLPPGMQAGMPQPESLLFGIFGRSNGRTRMVGSLPPQRAIRLLLGCIEDLREQVMKEQIAKGPPSGLAVVGAEDMPPDPTR